MTQDEKNQWHVPMFCRAVRFSEQVSQMRKNKPYNITFEGVSYFHRAVDGQYPSNSEQWLYFSFNSFQVSNASVLQELGCSLSFLGYFL